MDKNIEIKKVLFGGFDRKAVMRCIASITDGFQRYKKETVLRLGEMQKNTHELEEKYNALLEENAELREKISGCDESAAREKDKADIKALIDELTEKMNALAKSLSSDENSAEALLYDGEDKDVLTALIEKYSGNDN